MNNHIESERRWLVESYNPLLFLESKKLKIRQYYLESSETKTERIREIEDLNTAECSYYHTIKEFLSRGKNYKDEKEIDLTTFSKLMERVVLDRKVIKTRLIFNYRGLTFEFDIIEYPIRLFILELEIDNLDEFIHLPPFIKVSREITGEPERFSNYQLSKLGEKLWKKQ